MSRVGNNRPVSDGPMPWWLASSNSFTARKSKVNDARDRNLPVGERGAVRVENDAAGMFSLSWGRL